MDNLSLMFQARLASLSPSRTSSENLLREAPIAARLDSHGNRSSAERRAQFSPFIQPDQSPLLSLPVEIANLYP